MTARLFSLADFRRRWFVEFVICVVRWLEMLALALFAYQISPAASVRKVEQAEGASSELV